MVRDVFASSSGRACQSAVAASAPVVTSIWRRSRSPYHSTDRNVELKTKLSPAVTFGLLVVAAAASLVIALISCKALFRPDASVAGSVALKYVPRPLTAACHRSSMFSGAFDDGVGQLQTVPAVCHVHTVLEAVAPVRTE